MSAKNEKYVSPLEDSLHGQEQDSKEISEKINLWKDTGSYPANIQEIFKDIMDQEKYYRTFVQKLSAQPQYYRELDRVKALQKENLRELAILAPVCKKKVSQTAYNTAVAFGVWNNEATVANESCCTLQ